MYLNCSESEHLRGQGKWDIGEVLFPTNNMLPVKTFIYKGLLGFSTHYLFSYLVYTNNHTTGSCFCPYIKFLKQETKRKKSDILYFSMKACNEDR